MVYYEQKGREKAMQIERLKVFIHVAECMSFTRAAERSYISQSAVSQQIAALEKELGVTLLLRDRKGNVSLTREGSVFYEGCVQMLRTYEKTLAKMKHVRQEQEKVIRLGLMSGSDCSWLPEVTQRLSRNGWNGKVKPCYDSFSGLRRGLTDGRYDGAVTIEYVVQGIEGVEYEVLLEEAPVLVVSKQHPLAGRTSVRSGELQGEHFVTMGKEHSGGVFQRWMEARQTDGLTLNDVETVDSAEAQRMMVEMNAGVAILPVFSGQEGYDTGKCCAIRLEDTTERVRYVFAYRKEADSEAMRELICLTGEIYGRQTADAYDRTETR